MVRKLEILLFIRLIFQFSNWKDTSVFFNLLICEFSLLYSFFFWQYDWYTKKTSVVVDIVGRPREGKWC